MIILSAVAATARAQERPPIAHQVLAWKLPALPLFEHWGPRLVMDHSFVGFYGQGSRDRVVCASILDGQMQALIPRLPPELSQGGLTAARGVVPVVAVVVADGGAVAAFDACSLDERWRYTAAPGERVRAVVGIDRHFAAVVQGVGSPPTWRFVRLAAWTGTREKEEPEGSGPLPAILRAHHDLAVAIAPIGRGQQEMTALLVESGTIAWHHVVDEGPVTMGGGHVVITHFGRAMTMQVLDANTGGEVARVREPAWEGSPSLEVDGRQLVYVVGHRPNQVVTALDLPSGRARWRRDVPLPYLAYMPADDPPPLLLDEDAIYVASEHGRLIALERDQGHQVWSYGLGGLPRPLLAPWARAPRLVVPTDTGALFVFERRTERPHDAVAIEGRLHLPAGMRPRPVTLQLDGRRVRTDDQGRFELRAHAGEAVRIGIEDRKLAQVSPREHRFYRDRDGSQYLVLSEERRQRLELDADYPDE